jgi:hypothetical protein
VADEQIRQANVDAGELLGKRAGDLVCYQVASSAFCVDDNTFLPANTSYGFLPFLNDSNIERRRK